MRSKREITPPAVKGLAAEIPAHVPQRELVEAVIVEIQEVHRRIHDISRRLAKFERIFERVVREEIEQRVQRKGDGSDKDGGENYGRMSPLFDLRDRLRNPKGMDLGYVVRGRLMDHVATGDKPDEG